MDGCVVAAAAASTSRCGAVVERHRPPGRDENTYCLDWLGPTLFHTSHTQAHLDRTMMTWTKLHGCMPSARLAMEGRMRCTTPGIGLRVKVWIECSPRQRSLTENLMGRDEGRIGGEGREEWGAEG